MAEASDVMGAPGVNPAISLITNMLSASKTQQDWANNAYRLGVSLLEFSTYLNREHGSPQDDALALIFLRLLRACLVADMNLRFLELRKIQEKYHFRVNEVFVFVRKVYNDKTSKANTKRQFKKQVKLSDEEYAKYELLPPGSKKGNEAEKIESYRGGLQGAGAGIATSVVQYYESKAQDSGEKPVEIKHELIRNPNSKRFKYGWGVALEDLKYVNKWLSEYEAALTSGNFNSVELCLGWGSTPMSMNMVKMREQMNSLEDWSVLVTGGVKGNQNEEEKKEQEQDEDRAEIESLMDNLEDAEATALQQLMIHDSFSSE